MKTFVLILALCGGFLRVAFGAIVFFHYWGRGPAKDLASAVKSALPIAKK